MLQVHIKVCYISTDNTQICHRKALFYVTKWGDYASESSWIKTTIFHDWRQVRISTLDEYLSDFVGVGFNAWLNVRPICGWSLGIFTSGRPNHNCGNFWIINCIENHMATFRYVIVTALWVFLNKREKSLKKATIILHASQSPEPVFGDLFRSPGIDSKPGGIDS